MNTRAIYSNLTYPSLAILIPHHYQYIENRKRRTILLLFIFWFNHCQSSRKPGGNIRHTFASFRLNKGIPLIHGPNLRVLKRENAKKINQIKKSKTLVRWFSTFALKNYRHWLLTLSWDLSSNEGPKNRSRKSCTTCKVRSNQSGITREGRESEWHAYFALRALERNI